MHKKTLIHNPAGGGFSSGSSYEQIQVSAVLEMNTKPPAFASLVQGEGTAVFPFSQDTCADAPSMSYILWLMLKNMQARLQHLIFTKNVQQGRYGEVLVTAVPSDMKDSSYLTFPMMPLSETQSYDAKGCLVWVCSLSTWESAQWMLTPRETDLSLIHISEPTRPY